MLHTFGALVDGLQSASVWEITGYSDWRFKLGWNGFALRNDPPNG